MTLYHVKTQGSSNAAGTATVTVFNSNGLATTAIASNLVQPQDWNSAHNAYFTLSGNTLLTSTVSGANIAIAGSGALGMQGTGNSVVFSSPVASYWNNNQLMSGNIAQINQNGPLYGVSTSGVWVMYLPCAVNAQYIRFLGTPVFNTPTQTFGTSNNTTTSGTGSTGIYVQFFTSPITGASSNSWYQYTSGSGKWGHTGQYSAGAVGSNYTINYTFMYPQAGLAGNTTNTVVQSFQTLTNAGFTFMSSLLSNCTGLKYIDVPVQVQLPEGVYRMVMGFRTQSGGLQTIGRSWALTQVAESLFCLGGTGFRALNAYIGMGYTQANSLFLTTQWQSPTGTFSNAGTAPGAATTFDQSQVNWNSEGFSGWNAIHMQMFSQG
jgi:hypothetical protein